MEDKFSPKRGSSEFVTLPIIAIRDNAATPCHTCMYERCLLQYATNLISQPILKLFAIFQRIMKIGINMHVCSWLGTMCLKVMSRLQCVL